MCHFTKILVGARLDVAWRSAVAILLVLPTPRFLHVSWGQMGLWWFIYGKTKM